MLIDESKHEHGHDIDIYYHALEKNKEDGSGGQK
jgi:hypothetical protein